MLHVSFYEQYLLIDPSEVKKEGSNHIISIPRLQEVIRREICYCEHANFVLSRNGELLSLDENEIVVDEIDTNISVTLTNQLVGGKGGFGAQLRSLAKQKGGKQTTNFGACRDLSGRRLRHVNNEIIMRKWKESKETGEKFDPEQETATGIDLWFLAAPKWADGIKVDKKKRFMKGKMKTVMCIDWLRARKEGVPPPLATKDWGCPRGAYCEFAHGEDELRGEEKEKIVESDKAMKEREAQKKRDAYMKPLEAIRTDEEINDMVLEGLQAAAKRAKLSKDKAMVTAILPNSTSTASSSQGKESYEGPLQLFSGNVIVEIVEKVPQITGNSTFATIIVPNTRSCSEGCWYYEVELLSDGLMQIGWIDDEFRSESEEGLGVGDDSHSWGYDGFRKKFFHNGQEIEIEFSNEKYLKEKNGNDSTDQVVDNDDEDDDTDDENEENAWKEGDIIGCYLAIEPQHSSDTEEMIVTMYFTLNGKKLSPDFQFFRGKDKINFYPSISLEEQESIRWNLGQEVMKFPPVVTYKTCL